MSACELKLSGISAPNMRAKVESLLGTLQSTASLLAFLDAEKFTVIGVEISRDRSKPIIHIANTSRCAWLKRYHSAYNVIRSRGPYGTELVWRSDMMNCRVQWIERGN